MVDSRAGLLDQTLARPLARRVTLGKIPSSLLFAYL